MSILIEPRYYLVSVRVPARAADCLHFVSCTMAMDFFFLWMGGLDRWMGW